MRLRPLIPVFILCAAFAVAAMLVSDALAQQDPSSEKLAKAGIQYPITELGGVKNEAEARSFCDRKENRKKCFDFAKAHDLMPREEIRRAEAFFAAGEGPGGCTTPEACDNLCKRQENMTTCMRWALDHDGVVPDEERPKLEKALAAVERGVPLPEGCVNEESCKSICEDPQTVAQLEGCTKFGIEAGLLPDDVEPEQALKMVQAMKEGRLPFKNPREFEKCKNSDKETKETVDLCIQVGLEMGMMKPEEAEMAKAFFAAGGPQKLGCKGKDCKDFCEKNEENRQKCGEVMAPIFEANPNLLPPEAREQMREGAEQMRQAFEDMPGGARVCIEGKLGSDFVNRILAGDVPVPEMMKFGPKIGDEMRGCFEQPGFGGGPEGGFPKEAEPCFLEVFGVSDPRELKKPPTKDQEAKLRTCVEDLMGGPGGPPGAFPGEDGEHGEFPGAPGEFPGGPGGSPRDRGGAPPIPSGAQGECVKQVIGERPSSPPTQEQMAQIRECVSRQVRPQDGNGGEGEHRDRPREFFPPPGFESGSPPLDARQFPSGAPDPEQLRAIQEQYRNAPGNAGAPSPDQIRGQYEQQYQQFAPSPGGVPPPGAYPQPGTYPTGGEPYSTQPPSGTPPPGGQLPYRYNDSFTEEYEAPPAGNFLGLFVGSIVTLLLGE